MPWYFPWSDAIKKRACRYLLQRYMGQFLQEKLTLDQLSVDIYNGTGTIEELNLDVDTLNEMGEAYSLPVEFVDGYISSISVNIPWSSLLNDSSYVEVHGLMVTVQPKQRTNSGSMFESMWNSMTTSMQLAEECLKQETDDRTGEGVQPFEGLELFAQTIETVLRRIKVRFLDTVIRIEHVPKESRLGVALEIRIKKVDYFDEAGMDEASRDHSSNIYEPAAFSIKKFYIENVMLYSDEFPCKARTFARSLSSNGSTESKNSEIYATAPVSPDLPPQHTEFEKTSSVGDKKCSNTSLMPDPILICKLSGRQEVRLTIKQNDVLPGPKVDVEFNFGSSTYFLSPRQVHILIELAYGLAFPGIEDNSNVVSRHLSTNKPMEPGDYKRVEQELQKQLNPQLLGKSLQHHQGWSSQSLDDSDEDFHPMAAHPMVTSVGSDSCAGGPDMDSSMSSVGSGTLKAPSDTQLNSPVHYGRIGLPGCTNSPTLHQNIKRRTSKSKNLMQALLEDPSAELTHYKLRVSSLTVILLHDDILTTTAESCGLVAQSSIDQMKELADKFFSDMHIHFLSGGMNANDKNDIFAEICKLNHIRLVASPLIIEGKEKTGSSFRNVSASLSCGNLEIIECLLDKKPSQNNSQTLSVPDYSEILKFDKEESSFKPSWSEPCLRMKINHIQRDGIGGAHPFNRPRTDINVTMSSFRSEIDISIVDRINALLNPQPLCESFGNLGSALFTPSNMCNNQTCFHQAIEEGEITSDYKIDLLVSSPSVQLFIRFPIPDMRPHHDMDRMPWWKRNVRKDILTLKFKDASLHTSFGSRETSTEAEFRCRECEGLYQESSADPPLSFLKVTTENKDTLSELEQGFDWPRLVVRINPVQPPLILEEEIPDEPMDSMPASSIDTLVYQMFTTSKPEPSPFSSRKVLYESHPSQGDENNEKLNQDPFAESEQMVMPGDKAEMSRFIEKSTDNSRYVIELSLPKVDLFFPSKHFYEVIYNRINTDLCLWEPTAPKLMMKGNNHNLRCPPPRLDLMGTLMQETMYQTFSVCKSGLHYESSSEEEEESGIYFSVYDQKHKHKRQHQEPVSTRSSQNKIAFNITTNQGQLTVFTPFRDSSGNVIPEHHGELHLQIREGNCFVVMAYRGLSDVGHVCLQANQAALSHRSMVPTSTEPVNLETITEAYTSHLDPTLYHSEPGMYTKLNNNVGTGGDSLDMFSMAVKISLDSNLNLKTFKVAIGIREATWLYKMSSVNQSWCSQFIDFFDVNDYPVSGYHPSAIVTELHLHLWSCALDYRPLYVPLKAVITIESFSISSNIAAQTSTSLLRFIAEDAALFISDNCSVSSVDLKKNYVCVVDMGYFDLSLRMSDGKDPRHPHIDLRASNNIVHIRTCSDSCAALQNLLTYFANDGDLLDRSAQQKGDSEMQETIPQSSDSENSTLSKAQAEQVHDLMVEAMQESRSNSVSSSDGETTFVDHRKQPAEVFLFPDESQPSQAHRTEIMKELGDSALPTVTEDGHYSADEEFCILEDDPGIGIRPKTGESVVRILVSEPIRLIENHFAVPIGKIDQLKAPKHFPSPVLRYTLQEMSVVWHMYGGQDFESTVKERKAKEKQVKLATHESSNLHDSPTIGVAYSKGSAQEVHWMSGDSSPPSKASFQFANRNWQVQGGQGRLHNVLMELQMNKLRFQHEVYPENTEHAAHQILLIHEVEIRDRLASSQINKFLYQYSSEAMPRQSHANMVLIKALHMRPDPALPAQECSLKVSLLPLRLNIDQDALLFLYNFFSEVCQRDQVSSDPMGDSKHSSKSNTPHPSPVMTIMKPSGLTPTEQQQQLLITLEETPNMVQDLISPVQESYDFIPSQPIYFRSFMFSPDVPIRLDYHGKHVDMDQGALAGLIMGLGQLSCSELTLKKLNYRHGLLGCDKLLSYALGEWLQDIKKNQLPSLLGGVGPMHSLVQLVQGIRDLFWLPIEQYRKDGRIVRGLQRGANAFTTSTAMAALELTNRLVQTIQSAAETAYDMVSPGPSVKKLGVVSFSRRKRPSQPVDIREGMANAYNVVKEGLGDTARTLVKVASEEHEQKGLSGAVGGVLRQIPPSVVKPIILATEATSNVLGGMRHQLAPDTRREAAEKWRSEEQCT